MKIVIAGSMQFAKEMLETQGTLAKLGHAVFVSKFIKEFIGRNEEEKERIKLHQKINDDAIKEFWNTMKDADALLVLNYDKNGIKNYIGGNTFLEIGFAYVLGQKVFLLNPIPDITYYKSEIVAIKPTILNGDLSLIK